MKKIYYSNKAYQNKIFNFLKIFEQNKTSLVKFLLIL